MKKHLLTGILLAVGPVFAIGQDMPLSQVLIENEDWERVADGFEFTDGLCADPEGNLYFSDVKGGDAVFRLDLAGNVTRFIEEASGISGLQWGSDGRLYACVARQKKVVVFDRDGNETVLAEDVRPNDLVVTHGGDLYFTMTPTREIRRIDAKGKMTIVDGGNLVRPNGITLSPCQGTLAVSDHGGRFVWAYRVRADGALDAAQEFMPMRTPVDDPEVARGDGMATDVHGRYYVTSAEGLQVFDPTGRMGGVIAAPDPGSNLVSVCFAGPGHAWVYVANGSALYRRKTKTRGALFFAEPRMAESPPKD